jgi:tRNA A-37 threonylcarbamoyl transferase component Bud32
MDVSQLKKDNKEYFAKQKIVEAPLVVKPRGRKIRNSEPLDQRVTLTFTQTEKDKIIEHCEKVGINITVYLKRALKQQGII